MSWNPVAEKAFIHLKAAFTTSPILQHPNPEQPFTVEVDVCETGIGAVLSQHFGEGKNASCGIFF